jgi:hypothetical protein
VKTSSKDARSLDLQSRLADLGIHSGPDDASSSAVVAGHVPYEHTGDDPDATYGDDDEVCGRLPLHLRLLPFTQPFVHDNGKVERYISAIASLESSSSRHPTLSTYSSAKLDASLAKADSLADRFLDGELPIQVSLSLPRSNTAMRSVDEEEELLRRLRDELAVEDTVERRLGSRGAEAGRSLEVSSLEARLAALSASSGVPPSQSRRPGAGDRSSDSNQG